MEFYKEEFKTTQRNRDTEGTGKLNEGYIEVLKQHRVTEILRAQSI